jgi:hypothetical protein
MATLSFRPITVSFTPSARRELHAFVSSVYRGAWGEGLVPVVSLERSTVHVDQSTGGTMTRKPGFVLGATVVDHYRDACALALPRLGSLDGMGFLVQLPPRAAILDRIDFDWRGNRLLALN